MIRILFALLLTFSSLAAEPLRFTLNAEAAILMNADTGAILFEKNSHTRKNPASVTKIATLLYSLKVMNPSLDNHLKKRITITKEMVATTTEEAKKKSGYKLPPYLQETDGTHMGLKAGEEVNLKDILYGIMLVSANDGANALAYHCSGTVENFMEGLNAHLQAVGCKNTTFYNPHGLYYPNHKTTAYDLAVMTKEALKHPLFREIVASDKFTKGETNLQPAITFTQSNRLIRPGAYYYPKAIGVKTGYIRAAGHNLVAAATHEGRTLIAVVMKCSDRKHIFEETKKMFEAAFKETPVEKVVLDGGLQSFQLTANGAEKPVKAMLEDKLTYTCYPSEEPEVKCTVVWDEVKLPVSEGDRIGQVRLKTNEGRLLAQAPLYAYEDVSATFSHRSITSLTDLWSRFPALSIVVLSVILGVIILIIRRSLI